MLTFADVFYVVLGGDLIATDGPAPPRQVGVHVHLAQNRRWRTASARRSTPSGNGAGLFASAVKQKITNTAKRSIGQSIVNL